MFIPYRPTTLIKLRLISRFWAIRHSRAIHLITSLAGR
ncbi:hypothetical protein GXM_00984 [Nostoc sphaeroides CCNUC1]|uniref:Uncharacterized protein n=1 Tax=Nostoc sphaeroides CCNUC1 TaxID=2653204 RepID=A0A5P8VT63_9NOSO|nr:hypothetical protein GXM_00984 [Nostoc sphaeroides CCNUC1]